MKRRWPDVSLPPPKRKSWAAELWDLALAVLVAWVPLLVLAFWVAALYALSIVLAGCAQPQTDLDVDASTEAEHDAGPCVEPPPPEIDY